MSSKRYKYKKKKKYELSKFIYGLLLFLLIGFINNLFNSNNVSDSNTSTSNSVSDNSKTQVYFFDVGQADSALVVNGDDTMLIDAGNNEDGQLLVNYIKSLGITQIDYIVGTHPHEDHIGGIDDIINSFDIGTIYMPNVQTNTKTFEDVLDAIANKDLTVTAPTIGTTFNVGENVCTVLSIDDNEEDLNSCSIVIRMEFGNTSFLFTGDIESSKENQQEWEKVDVLKVAHHGSKTSSSKKFLNSVLPSISIISVGQDNDYNHPSQSALNRLNSIETTVYRTDLDGTIIVTSDGNNLEVEKVQTNTDKLQN